MPTAAFHTPGFNAVRFAEIMESKGLDALLLSSPENVYYVTGFPAIPSAGNPILYALRNVLPFYTWVDRQGSSTLLCWGGALPGVEYSASRVVPFADAAGAALRLEELLASQPHEIKKVGIESALTADVYLKAEKVFGSDCLVMADDVLREMRLVKSPTELDYLRNSTKIVEQTVGDLIPLVKQKVSRPELIHQAKYRMMMHGATGVGHVTISFGDSNPEVEIAEYLGPNKLVVLDLGALYLGYASDNRRLLFTGVIPAGMTALHQTMCAIVDEIAAAMKPGVLFDDLYRLALKLYKQNGLNPFIPNVGHTIGLNTEEAWIYKDSPVVVQPGMVINLELYSLYETGELIGDEETYIIGENRAEQITSLPRGIIQVVE